MKKRYSENNKYIKITVIFVLVLISIFIIPKIEYAAEDKQTWRISPDCKIQEIPVEQISTAYYKKEYNLEFVDNINSGWSGKDLYGGAIQGSTVTERHLIFAIIRGGVNGYIFVARKSDGVIEQSIPVPYDETNNNSIYGHMNDMTYNPNTKEVLIPVPTTSGGTGKVVIFKYNSNGSLNTTPTIVNQCDGCNCGNMAYSPSLDKYLFNAGAKIYIVSRNGQGFKNAPDKVVDFNWGEFRYMTSQSIETSGKYFYKIFSENGAPSSKEYYDSKEQGSCVAATYEIETGDFVKGIYIPNKSVSGELEGISFDPVDGSMILAYNVDLNVEKKRYNNTAFYKLKSGNQVLNEKEQYFYKNGFVAPKATITAEKYGVKDNLIRYYNGNNNLGDGHSNYTTTWTDLAGKYDGSINGRTNFTNNGYLNLDGNNKWVNIGEMPVEIYDNVTMEIQVDFYEIQDGEVELLSNMNSGGYALLMVDGKPVFQAYINGENQSVKFDEKLLKGKLYNITGTFDGEKLSLYIDGVLRKQKKIVKKSTVKVPDNHTVMAIGAHPNGREANGGFINGAVYSTRVYQSVLSEEEIQKNMNADRLTTNVLKDNHDNISLTINFSEPINNFTVDDIVVKNGKKGTLKKNSDTQYMIDITEIKASAYLEISIEDGVFTDLTGNEGIGTRIKRYRDSTDPIVTITANTEDLTINRDIIYTISFNEKISGFNIDSIIVINGKISNFIELSAGQEYTLQVSNNDSGEQKIIIPERACYDSTGNPNIETSKTVRIDRIPPTITITPNSNKACKNTDIKITVNDTISGLSDTNKYQYALSNSNKNIPTTGWIEYISGESIKIGENITGIRYIWVKQISDKLGNKSIANQVSEAFVFDNTLPIIKKVEKNPMEWIEGNAILSVDAEDETSGLAEEAYSFDGGSTWQRSNEKEYTENTENILIKVKDKAGNIAEYEKISITKIIKVTGIKVTKKPTKVSYVKGKPLNIEGVEITATYADGTTRLVQLSADKFTGYDANKLGEQTITVTYAEGITDTFKVNVHNNVTKIEITKKPTNLSYKKGEPLNIEGLEITATYEDGTTKLVQLSADKFTGYNANKLGEQTITVTYAEGIKDTFKVTVIEDLYVKLNNYEEVEESGIKYIEKILPNTAIEVLKRNLETNGTTVELYKNNEKITDDSKLIGTGMEIVIKLNDEEIRYTAVVTGDLIGNGKMEIGDLSKLARYTAKIDTDLKGAYLRASDIVKDGKYGRISDISKMARVIAKIDTL